MARPCLMKPPVAGRARIEIPPCCCKRLNLFSLLEHGSFARAVARLGALSLCWGARSARAWAGHAGQGRGGAARRRLSLLRLAHTPVRSLSKSLLAFCMTRQMESVSLGLPKFRTCRTAGDVHIAAGGCHAALPRVGTV